MIFFVVTFKDAFKALFNNIDVLVWIIRLKLWYINVWNTRLSFKLIRVLYLFKYKIQYLLQGIFYRFQLLMYFTVVCAGLTIAGYIMSEVSIYYEFWYFNLTWASEQQRRKRRETLVWWHRAQDVKVSVSGKIFKNLFRNIST